MYFRLTCILHSFYDEINLSPADDNFLGSEENSRRSICLAEHSIVMPTDPRNKLYLNHHNRSHLDRLRFDKILSSGMKILLAPNRVRHEEVSVWIPNLRTGIFINRVRIFLRFSCVSSLHRAFTLTRGYMNDSSLMADECHNGYKARGLGTA